MFTTSTTISLHDIKLMLTRCNYYCFSFIIRCVAAPKVVFIKDAIQKLGCALPDAALQCKPCGLGVTGGFTFVQDSSTGANKPQVLLCEDAKIMTQEIVMETTLAHELIHAYDACRAKMDYSNCLHHACTEIRASNLR
jgi:mitochondrial inner membrane protease ATP23